MGKNLYTLFGLLQSVLISCYSTQDPISNSETDFLSTCADDCPGALECIWGICTVRCDPTKNCEDIHLTASCLSCDDFINPEHCQGEPNLSVCAVSCKNDNECAVVGPDHTCYRGYCRVNTFGCDYNGALYSVGESFPDPDGCNICSCGQSGKISCTTTDCRCFYGGKTYDVGESFPDLDGCNTCSCRQSGKISCTMIGCLPDNKTGFLSVCLDACPGDLECVCGICTAVCDSDVVCGHMQLKASCIPFDDFSNQGLCENDSSTSVCDVKCISDNDCNELSPNHTCFEGYCRVNRIGCEYAGVVHPMGETFPAGDGCNTCNCTLDGIAACTIIECLPDD